jgi:hypothetical protein
MNTDKMNRFVFYLTTILMLSTVISCSTDADEAEQQSINAQNQLKTIKIEVISDLPISEIQTGQSGENRFQLVSGGGSTLLMHNVPNQIGENTLVQTFTAAPSSNLGITIYRYNWSANTTTGEWFCFCGDVTINVYSNNVLFHTVTKEMGGASISSGNNCPCSDGHYLNSNVIIPM